MTTVMTLLLSSRAVSSELKLPSFSSKQILDCVPHRYRRISLRRPELKVLVLSLKGRKNKWENKTIMSQKMYYDNTTN